MNKNKKVKLRVSLYMGIIGFILVFFRYTLGDTTTNDFLKKILEWGPFSLVFGFFWLLIAYLTISWYQSLLDTN